MFKAQLNYQASFFVPIEDVIPSAETIPPLLEAFQDKELLPTTFLQLAGGARHTRLRLSSSDKEWVVDLDVERIRIIKNPIKRWGENMGSIEEFIEVATDCIQRIHSLYPRKGSRLSLITKGILRKMTESQLCQAYKRVFQPIPFYSENSPVDWESRAVARASVEFGGRKELLNVITSLSRVQGQFADPEEVVRFDGIELGFDINTYQGNKESRFSVDDLPSFFEKALEIRTQLITEVRELLDGG